MVTKSGSQQLKEQSNVFFVMGAAIILEYDNKIQEEINSSMSYKPDYNSLLFF